MSRNFHIAVLECDTPVPAVKDTRGSYGQIFESLLKKGLQELDPPHNVTPVITKWDVVASQEYPDLHEVDAILISGSKHTAFKDDEWIVSLVAYVKSFLETANKPAVGICFGHQIIGRALGAKVGVSPGGWEISVENIDLTPNGKKLLGAKALNLHQMHRDAILEVPQGALNLGSSPRCEIQGLYKPGRVLSFQAHPEFDSEIMSEILKMRHSQNIFNDSMYEDGSSRANKKHDGVVVSALIWKFVLGQLD
ncbi:unnamed protein product [Clonostachys chloroleuca]|uniref:Glutamine amidotransferase domain-containing protein n=1 Tax=Clonostachys chloroleuca TaxID=1926264 RepID=A0AA35QB65_9HYPO|nr:unnamed protein product [Clonostachys chloroleuca]